MSNFDVDPQELAEASNLEEMQKAFKEINKLKTSGHKSDEYEEEAEEEQTENSEEEASEETNESTETEEEPAPKKEKKEQEKIWKYRKAKYKALHEKEELRKENELLKQKAEQMEQLLSQSVNSGTYHYSKSAEAELERAKAAKIRAIEDGDAEGLVTADMMMNQAQYTLNEIKKWATPEPQRARESTKEVTNYSNNSNAIQQEIVSDWLDNHPYLQPRSNAYNPKLAVQVNEYVKELDDDLRRTGRENLYFSDNYFQAIDEFIEENKHKIYRKPKPLDAMNHIGGVRSSYSSASTSKSPERMRISLTEDEKHMCDNAGLAYKDWEKYKLMQLKSKGR